MEALVTISGWVGGELEFRHIKTPTASFRLACTPRVWRSGGWVDGETTWITVMCFRTLAENAAASIAKGDAVMVSGKLRTQVWQRDGQTLERTVLEAQTIGHDLTRGTSAFRKAERQQPVEDTTDLHELIAAVERQPAGEEAAATPESREEAA
jgi:single-strand DNA-binding protein